MNRLKLLGLLIVWLVCACRPNEPSVERSIGKNQSVITSYLNAHIVDLRKTSAKVAVLTDGKLGIYEVGEKWTTRFVLGMGDRFRTLPDHHAATYFTIQQVNATSVLLRYSSTFDHRSFGKNLITVDEGEVEIQFK
jgi:hypothetical protein